MSEESFYARLNPQQKQKVQALVNAIFTHNAAFVHPFLDELHRLKLEEYAKQILEGKS